MKTNNTFSYYINEFNAKYKNQEFITSFVSVHLIFNKKISLWNTNKECNEQYYKYQFLYALINSSLYSKDYIGTEIQFPKGNKNAKPLKIDIAIFDNKDWFKKYNELWANNKLENLDWLYQHLCAVCEIKKENNKNIQEVWDKQLKPYLKESERSFCLGILYDMGRLYLFKKENNKYIRLNEEYNEKGVESISKELSLHLPDPYSYILSFQDLLNKVLINKKDKSNRNIYQLEVISGIQSIQINDAMSCVLRIMDKVGLFNQKGFEILIKTLTLKIYDEKQNEKYKNKTLSFYIQEDEYNYIGLSSEYLQSFLQRIIKLKNCAIQDYDKIITEEFFNLQDENNIRVLCEVVFQFQDYSFVRSQKTDLYQLVFYKFASNFVKDRHAQFITPLPLIDFLVSIVNPRNNETVIDPTVGIADFLSVSYVNSNSKLEDSNIYGMDIDNQMVMLATLNMLLNGDGNSIIKTQADGYGSLFTKFSNDKDVLQLIPSMNKNGAWDNRPDIKKLKKFDVVLTNPPFGDDRAFRPITKMDKEVVECYELWGLYKQNRIDMGVLFLENAYRILKENGRLGIVLSNSIASIKQYEIARKWLMDKMRIVAIFDMPSGIFAETAVNTSIIVAYKSNECELKKLQSQNYEIFIKEIKKVGYEVKTKKRIKVFETKYKINYDTFDIEINGEGMPIMDEDFTQTIKDFREWCKRQESMLQTLFIRDN